MIIGFYFFSEGTYLFQVTLVSMLRGFLPGFLLPFVGDPTKIGNLVKQIGFTQVLCSIILMPLILYQALGIPLMANGISAIMVQLFLIPFYSIIYIALKQIKAREMVKELLEDQRLLLDTTSLQIWYLKDEETYGRVNQSHAEFLGVTKEDLEDKSLYEIMKKREEAKVCIEGNRRVFTSKEPIQFREAVINGSGRTRILSIMKTPKLNSLGEVEKVVCHAEDITQQIKVEEELLQTKEFLQNIIESIPDPVFVKDKEHSWILLNKALCDFVGYPKEMLLGKTDHHIFPKVEADIFWEKDALVFETGKTNVNEEVITDSSGQEHFISTKKSLFNLKGSKEPYLVGIITDITQQKLFEAQHASYTKEIESLYRQLDKELNKASEIHQHILPMSLPVIENLRFSAYYQPAERIGGDFYDVIQVDKKLVLYVSDVSGHGLDSAMLSFFVKHTIKSYLSFSSLLDITPTRILEYLNEEFNRENYPLEYFISIFLGVLDLDSMEMVYSGAGFSEKPLVQLGNNDVLKLKAKGLFILKSFLQDRISFQEERVTLTPGTTVVIYSDGLTEENKGGEFYRNRFSEVFYRNTHLPPFLISQAVQEDFRYFNLGSLKGVDDITFLIFQVEPESKKRKKLKLLTDLEQLRKGEEEFLAFFDDIDRMPLFLTGVKEMIFNAMEHGNRWDPSKWITMELFQTDTYYEVVIEDEGEGFNWKEKIGPPVEIEGRRKRGRGIAMTRLLCDGFYYNVKGNQATIIMKR